MDECIGINDVIIPRGCKVITDPENPDCLSVLCWKCNNRLAINTTLHLWICHNCGFREEIRLKPHGFRPDEVGMDI